MLPNRCSQPPCMNMAVKIVTAFASGLPENRAGMNDHSSMNIPAGKLDEEDQDIKAGEGIGDVGGSPPLRVVVADREHAGVLPRFGSGSAAILAEVGGKSIGLGKPGANGGADWQRFSHKRQIPK